MQLETFAKRKCMLACNEIQNNKNVKYLAVVSQLHILTLYNGMVLKHANAHYNQFVHENMHNHISIER